MAVNMNLTLAADIDGAARVSQTPVFSDESPKIVDLDIAGGSTDTQVNIAMVRAKVKAFLMQCDRDITVEVNDGTTPTKTWALKANKPMVYHVDNVATSTEFFGSADITKLHLTLAAGNSARFQIRAQEDAT